MNVIVATEGDSEVGALPPILGSVQTGLGPLGAKVLKVSCQPDGPALGIARATHPALKIAASKRVQHFILVLDREKRSESSETLASAILAALEGLDDWQFRISVVIKDRTFENWLVADLNALKSQQARFSVSAAMVKQVEPGKADHIQAIELLKKSAQGRSYDKKVDGLNIARRLDIESAALHSRSFRHFLHVLGHNTYSDQCRVPVTQAP